MYWGSSKWNQPGWQNITWVRYKLFGKSRRRRDKAGDTTEQSFISAKKIGILLCLSDLKNMNSILNHSLVKFNHLVLFELNIVTPSWEIFVFLMNCIESVCLRVVFPLNMKISEFCNTLNKISFGYIQLNFSFKHRVSLWNYNWGYKDVTNCQKLKLKSQNFIILQE